MTRVKALAVLAIASLVMLAREAVQPRPSVIVCVVSVGVFVVALMLLGDAIERRQRALVRSPRLAPSSDWRWPKRL